MNWRIATHKRPDLDAIATIWLLKKFGEEQFPGIAKATIMFVENGNIPEGENVIAVDVGGGMFDHHPQSEHPDDCAITLMAKHLEVHDDPALETILRFVANNDLKGSAHPFDLAYIIKLMNSFYSNKPERVINWATKALEAKYQEQFSFFSEAKEEFEQKAEIDEIKMNNGRGERVLKIVIIVSDNENIAKYARSHFGCKAAVVIQKQTTGNVQIYVNKQYGLRLHDVAQMIRLEEQKIKGLVETTDWKELSSEGNKVKGVKEWYYHKGLEALLNGSLTAKVPPTSLPLERIRELVKLGIWYTLLPNSVCRKEGYCTGVDCEWYEYGLSRCRKLRYDTRHS